MQSVQAVCGELSALHTLLSLYFCVNSTIMPSGHWFTGFLCKRDDFSFKSGNDYGSWKSMDARDLADVHFRFFIFCPNAGNGFEDKESLSRQAK